MDIKQEYEHSAFGNAVFKLCANWTKFLVKHKVLYYILNCTWGLLLTLVGIIVTLAFLVVGERPYTFEGMLCSKVGPAYWGGLSLGLSIFKDIKSEDNYINSHEFGHSFQNALFGVFTPFIITIPSACRYGYQTIRDKKGLPNKPYDGFGVEDAATQCGEYAVLYLSQEIKK